MKLFGHKASSIMTYNGTRRFRRVASFAPGGSNHAGGIQLLVCTSLGGERGSTLDTQQDGTMFNHDVALIKEILGRGQFGKGVRVEVVLPTNVDDPGVHKVI
ncbi:unnamed protein product [Linum trigynum]|uniref:Uncharacterized protein n=1 Tax=Linum trigynum TaxID=586398 RepID=A0AAV2G6K0_9ROSI